MVDEYISDLHDEVLMQALCHGCFSAVTAENSYMHEANRTRLLGSNCSNSSSSLFIQRGNLHSIQNSVWHSYSPILLAKLKMGDFNSCRYDAASSTPRLTQLCVNRFFDIC
jgi:hypothetical protein